MILKRISILNYKNLEEVELGFSAKLNCFFGLNGMGKTNLLDAVYFLSFCKSSGNPIDSQNIRHEQDFFVIQGFYEAEDGTPEEIYCGMKRRSKKQFKRNKKEYSRFSDHIGFLPLVMVSPADSELIAGGSEERRRFMDVVISQYDKEYLEALIRYNKALAQRNTLLKSEFPVEEELFLVWEEMMAQAGAIVFQKREAFIREFDAALKNEYAVTDPDVTLTCAAAETAKAVSAERTVTLVQALTAMPQGVEAMDTDFPGLVQTSLNMGVVKLGGDGLHIAFSIRSSIASRKLMLAQRVRAVAALAGGTVAERGVYPGWQYKRESQFRDTLLAAYKDLTGKDGVVEATHGGLECGLLMEKIPGLDAVSMGPELHDVHSVRERLSVPSTERTYELVCELLRRSC